MASIGRIAVSVDPRSNHTIHISVITPAPHSTWLSSAPPPRSSPRLRVTASVFYPRNRRCCITVVCVLKTCCLVINSRLEADTNDVGKTEKYKRPPRKMPAFDLYAKNKGKKKAKLRKRNLRGANSALESTLDRGKRRRTEHSFTGGIEKGSLRDAPRFISTRLEELRNKILGSERTISQSRTS